MDRGAGAALRLGRRLLPGVAYTAYPAGDPGGVPHLRAEVGVPVRP